MNDREKVEWAKRAFAEIATECQEIASLDIVDKVECRAWNAIRNHALRFIKILEQ